MIAEDPEVYERIEDTLAHYQSFNYHNQRWPILIPSRGRPQRQPLAKALDLAGLDYQIVIEPQDYNEYDAEGYPLNVLWKNDQGIAYARNHCLALARQAGREYVWVADDDISRLTLRRDGKPIVVGPRVYIGIMEEVASWFDTLGGIGGASAVWAYTHDGKPPVSFNNMLYGIALFNTTTGAEYRPGTLEDHDFAQQILSEGWPTLLFRQLCFESPASGSVKGGNADTLFLEREAAVDRLIADWPGQYYKAKRKDGTPQAKPRGAMWSRFPQRPEWA